MTSFIIVILLIFLDYKKGPEWLKKYAPFVYLGAIWLKCIFYPVLNLSVLLYITWGNDQS
jgi:hypothetical protein